MAAAAADRYVVGRRRVLRGLACPPCDRARRASTPRSRHWLTGRRGDQEETGLAVRIVTYGTVDRAVHAWIADGCGRSTIKNSLAILVRVLEQAVGDRIIDHNRARVTGWQREYQRAEDELDDPRSLALPDWDALAQLAAAVVARSADHFTGWGEVFEFTACTAARIGETLGVRRADIGTKTWTWNVRRPTTPGPGGLMDKGTKGRRARLVPVISEVLPLIERRLASISDDSMSRLFTGPRGGRIRSALPPAARAAAPASAP